MSAVTHGENSPKPWVFLALFFLRPAYICQCLQFSCSLFRNFSLNWTCFKLPCKSKLFMSYGMFLAGSYKGKKSLPVWQRWCGSLAGFLFQQRGVLWRLVCWFCGGTRRLCNTQGRRFVWIGGNAGPSPRPGTLPSPAESAEPRRYSGNSFVINPSTKLLRSLFKFFQEILCVCFFPSHYLQPIYVIYFTITITMTPKQQWTTSLMYCLWMFVSLFSLTRHYACLRLKLAHNNPQWTTNKTDDTIKTGIDQNKDSPGRKKCWGLRALKCHTPARL